jgi:ABC-type proline/glycine betaine transport system permease subunit
MISHALLAALVNLGGSGNYIHWGFIQISVANLVVILLMIAVFVLAILLPFPRHGRRDK